MNLIIRLIFASILSFIGAAFLLLPGSLILLDTPFASTPLIGRLPGVSERFCPEGAGMIMERVDGRGSSPGRYTPASFKYRAVCIDSNGARVADVSSKVETATYLGSAGLGYLIAWPALFWMIGQSLRNRSRREKWFILVTISASLALLAWAAIYIMRQPTTQEMERAAMIALAVAVVFVAIFIFAQSRFHKRNGA
jgi:hypothetical protein